MLERLYFDDNPIGWPKEVLVPELPADPALYEEWLSELRESKVTIRVPQRGDKRKLHATVTQNAEESFTRHRLSAAAITTVVLVRSTSCRSISTFPMPRCGSSATT